MAIARLSMKVGKAGKAAPHAAYIAREGKYAARLEKGERLAATDAGNMPAWAQAEPGQFWLAADANERANGTTYREMEIALPRELTTEQQTALVREWVAQEIGDRHAYQWAIHVPTAADGGEQPHVHLMFSERQVDGIERDPSQYFKRYNSKNPEKGGARKGYGPNAGKTLTQAERAADLKELRSRWEVMTNQHLDRAGHTARIDMRSHADAGRAVPPERKQLPSEWRGKGRDNVIEFRAAKAALMDAARDVLRDVGRDVGAQVISLQAEREKRQARTAAVALVRAADPDRTAKADTVRDEFAGRDQAEIKAASERAAKELGQYRERLAALALAAERGTTGPVWMAEVGRHRAAQEFQQASGDLDHWRKAHPIRSALGIGSRSLVNAKEQAAKKLEQAEQAKRQVDQQHAEDTKKAKAGWAAADRRRSALGALYNERQAEDVAIAKVDPKGPEARRVAVRLAEQKRQQQEAAQREAAKQAARDRARSRGPDRGGRGH